MLWKNVEQYYLTITKEFHGLCLREVIIGITMSKCPLLNYLILIGKLYSWIAERVLAIVGGVRNWELCVGSFV